MKGVLEMSLKRAKRHLAYPEWLDAVNVSGADGQLARVVLDPKCFR